jgi:hypothetical protein
LYDCYFFFEDNSNEGFGDFKAANSFLKFQQGKKDLVFSAANEFDSYLLSEMDLKMGQKRLLDTDRHFIGPSLTALRFIVSSIDVLHSFSLSSVGIKVDAVAGRLNMVSLLIARDGILTGQCSELCGSGHSNMPIVMEVMRFFDFRSYLENNFWELAGFEGNCPLLSSDNYSKVTDILINKLSSLKEAVHLSVKDTNPLPAPVEVRLHLMMIPNCFPERDIALNPVFKIQIVEVPSCPPSSK